MHDTPRHIRKLGARAGLALAGLLAVAGCDRHSEDDARAMLAGWFDLGETLYFKSQRGCTAGVFRVKTMDVKSRVPLFDNAEAVVVSGRQEGAFALSVPGKTPDKLFIELMNVHRPTGVAIQAAGLEAKPCMNEKARNSFFAALNADPSVVVFSRPDASFAVLDPVRGIVVLTSGGD
ncbi:hypothetical protein RXV86_04490 [Alisedimentitalea sp. MJ-SS2]|uniref:hypothetical protein n=1 Tax=Aliisedimentitalea sp. MJ-SS2 TaxID=3049795 RepID=UPI002910DFB8|nr:hypothetical protein [Alisedimentitalea sp. MJ-SS2]MDU8926637.1 hypothetical protein [Alisedimentitalea sp. MJ-SS2]